MVKLEHRLHVLIYPAHDLPGQWMAHCLELDIISQGNSQPHALDMIAEAIEVSAAHNIEHGRPPLVFRSAPDSDWALLKKAELLVSRIIHLRGNFSDEITLMPVVSCAG